jgi:hypothetical protein
MRKMIAYSTSGDLFEIDDELHGGRQWHYSDWANIRHLRTQVCWAEQMPD